MSEAKKVDVSISQGTKETLEERVTRMERAIATIGVETVEETLQKLESSDSKQPLIKGFKDKTVIFPLALLQRQMSALSKGLDDGLKQAGQGNIQMFQYVMQQLGPFQRQLATIDNTVEAIVNLSGFSDEAIQAEIDNIVAKSQAEQEAREDERVNRKVVDRAAKIGDVVKINYLGKVDGEAFEGGTAKNYHLELGTNTFIPGFEDQVVGVKAGETKDIKVTFPEEYGASHLAGKEAIFTVDVIAVKELQEVVEDTFQEG